MSFFSVTSLQAKHSSWWLITFICSERTEMKSSFLQNEKIWVSGAAIKDHSLKNIRKIRYRQTSRSKVKAQENGFIFFPHFLSSQCGLWNLCRTATVQLYSLQVPKVQVIGPNPVPSPFWPPSDAPLTTSYLNQFPLWTKMWLFNERCCLSLPLTVLMDNGAFF